MDVLGEAQYAAVHARGALGLTVYSVQFVDNVRKAAEEKKRGPRSSTDNDDTDAADADDDADDAAATVGVLLMGYVCPVFCGLYNMCCV